MSKHTVSPPETTNHRLMSRMQHAFGTWIEVTLFAPGNLAANGLQAAHAAIQDIHLQTCPLNPESDLNRVNLYAWRRPVSVSPSTYRLLALARHIARKSDGLFDFTHGGCLVKEGQLPDHGFRNLDGAHAWDRVELLPRLRIRLKRPLVLNLADIARGFAVDAAVHAMLRHGITRGRVNAGSELRLFGTGTTPIVVHESGGTTSPIGAWSNTAIATSAGGLSSKDQARIPACMLVAGDCDGAACPHFRQCPRAWTVMAAEAWRADALTKVAARAPDAGRAARIARLGGQLIARNAR